MLFQTGFRVVLLVFSLTIPFLKPRQTQKLVALTQESSVVSFGCSCDAETNGGRYAAGASTDRFIARDIRARVHVVHGATVAVQIEDVHAEIDGGTGARTRGVRHTRRRAEPIVTVGRIGKHGVGFDAIRVGGILPQPLPRRKRDSGLPAQFVAIGQGVGHPLIDVVLYVDRRGSPGRVVIRCAVAERHAGENIVVYLVPRAGVESGRLKGQRPIHAGVIDEPQAGRVAAVVLPGDETRLSHIHEQVLIHVHRFRRGRIG